jgi:hypothetical protein
MKQHRFKLTFAAAALAVGFAAVPAAAQAPVDDPFYQPPAKPKVAKPAAPPEPDKPTAVPVPTISQRTQEYQAIRQQAIQSRQPVPNPVGQYLVSEVSVLGVFETEKGLGVFVEAGPTKQTFFITPGTKLYNGELIEIQPGNFSQPARAVFRERIDYVFKKVRKPDIHTVVKVVGQTTTQPSGD